MNQSNSSKQVLLSVIGVAILVVAVVGVSFAFFNYTRTGQQNTVRTGQIYFMTDYAKFDVTNLFPVDRSVATSKGATTSDIVGVTTVNVSGYTTYTGGIDYMVSIDTADFNTTVPTATEGTAGAVTTLPISINVTQSGLGGTNEANANTINVTQATRDSSTLQVGGANQDKITLWNYELLPTLADDGDTGLTDDTAVTAGDRAVFPLIQPGNLLAKGHIATDTEKGVSINNSTGAVTTGANRGTITIKVYLDRDMIAITDTLATDTNVPNVPNTDPAVPEYTNGTSTDWLAGRTRFTTAQWNAMSNTPVTFKIRVTAGETHVDANGAGVTTDVIGAH